MKMRFLVLSVVAASFVLLAGCTIETPREDRSGIQAPGQDVVVNEVFRTPLNSNNPYSWIELYNPTNSYIPWYTQTRVDSVTLARERLIVRFRARVRIYTFQASNGQLVSNPSFILLDSIFDGYFTNYHTDQVLTGFGLAYVDHYYSPTDDFIPPGGYVVIVNNKDKFDAHVRVGPSNPAIFEMTLSFNSILGTPSPGLILPVNQTLNQFDAQHPYYWLGSNALWDLADAGEVALMRVSDTVHLTTGSFGQDSTYLTWGPPKYVDVVRYGNYRPSPDPFPDNKPVGYPPLDWSVARYQGYYKTGNTADEFYMSPDPIPGWVNQRQKH